MTKTIGMLFKLDQDVAKLLRRTVKRPHTLSGFVQDAIVKALRAHRNPLEYIAEGKSLSEPTPLDREDGVPWTHADSWSLKGWRDYWDVSPAGWTEINAMRDEDGREHLTTKEIDDIVAYMGTQPGWKRGKK